MAKSTQALDDIRSLIFDGFIKEVVHVGDAVIVIKTLSPSDETYISDNFSNIGNEYSLMAVAETIKRSIHSVNGCVIPENDRARDRINDWSRIIITNIFKIYLSLGDRVHEAIKSIDEFIKTDTSKFKWSAVKNSKSGLGHSLEYNYIQQLWIYINEQNDIVDNRKHDWQSAEYIAESICTFINPKAMRQIQQKRSEEQQEQIEYAESNQDIEMKAEDEIVDTQPVKTQATNPQPTKSQPVVAESKKDIKPITKSEENKVIENNTDSLFEAIKPRPNETKMQREQRVAKAVEKSMEEDEFDKIMRENDEFHFARNLRIKKENARRIKKSNSNRAPITIVDDPSISGITVGHHIVSSIGDDDEATVRYDASQSDNQFYVNGIDYSDICMTKAYEILKNRDKIFNDVSHESDDETIKWINYYIDLEKEIGIEDEAVGPGDRQSELLNRRETAAKGGGFDARRQAMLNKMKQDQQGNDEIHIGD